jgi:hypothetical protein
MSDSIYINGPAKLGRNFIVINNELWDSDELVTGADLFPVITEGYDAVRSAAWSADVEWAFIVMQPSLMSGPGVLLLNTHSKEGWFCRKRSTDFIRHFLDRGTGSDPFKPEQKRKMKQLGFITIDIDRRSIQKHDIYIDYAIQHETTQAQLTEIESDPNFVCWVNVAPEQGYIFWILLKPIIVCVHDRISWKEVEEIINKNFTPPALATKPE